MPSSTEVDTGEATVKKRRRRFDARDWPEIAENIVAIYEHRKTKRSDSEKQWKDIDRQIEMEPHNQAKLLADGSPDKDKAWMAEMELPLQAQTLALTQADARRMLFPDSGPWFRAKACVDGDFLDSFSTQDIRVNGESEDAFLITEQNVSQIAMAWVMHQFRQFDLRGHYDLINADAIKYGMGIGRQRMVTKKAFSHTARGTMSAAKTLPVIFPVSRWDVYLEPDTTTRFSEGYEVAPAVVMARRVKLTDLILTANSGSSDPNLEVGGWMPKNLSGLKTDPKDDTVLLIEYEGDLIVERKTTRNLFLPGVIVTVAHNAGGKNDKGTSAVVRFRWRSSPESTYLLHSYQLEDARSQDGTSVMRKGRPVQIGLVDALNRIMDGAALKCGPPVGYDRTDQWLQAQGGPKIHPYAVWESNNAVVVHDEVGGDLGAMVATFQMLQQLYYDVTETQTQRRGGQAVSHVTNFGKQREAQKSELRTLSYVTSVGHGPLLKGLQRTYTAARNAMRGKERFYMEEYDGWVEVSKAQLPELVHFQWFGSSGPAEQQQAMERRVQSLLLAAQIDEARIARGESPRLDMVAAIDTILREGGWSDVDVLTRAEEPVGRLLSRSATGSTLREDLTKLRESGRY
jgi:hypothetical protein